MVSRRDLKYQHEKAVLDRFAEFVRENGRTIVVLERPDPPDALAEIDENRTWIEITDAFLDEQYAKSVTSAASHDVPYVRNSGRLVFEPDEQFMTVLAEVILAKYDKRTIREIYADRGPGVLLVGILTPFSDALEISVAAETKIANLIATKDVKVFKEIFVYDVHEERQFCLLYKE